MQHHGAALRALSGDWTLPRALATDWRAAEVEPRLRALLAYAVKLTRTPEEMTAADAQALRDVGLDDEGILHACEVVAYYNFVNRLADGLGVELEEDWPHPILGDESP